ncbi:G1 family glutamic endopeptidase [Kutzneria chonburiensis]|uniref:G1 family glutamic endopeptidase n=1 Tax=Kutzneria chonburiensis TaxID=1483604 RepID=A0ABV6N8T7_9PSEU|nr:G1 family glutamic endopeptidase [Kutzneria chonburiensis]
MTETTMAPSELGVRLFTPPPADFDPFTADQRELLVHGFPARPDQDTERPLYTQWKRRVSRKYTRIEPVFVRNTDKVHGPMRGPSAEPGQLLAAHKANATSTNWSGSAVFAAAGDSFKWVEGEWTVADPADPKGGKTSYYSSSWVGIDGWGSPDVLQAGTESSLVNGVKKVYAWWEWYPDFEIAISNFPISAGDTMFCLICATSATTASIWLTNDSTDQSVSFAITAPSGTTLRGNVAEWIVETPNVGGSPTTLPDYGVVYFDDAQALANSAGWIAGNTGTPLTMVNSGGTALSTPTLKATDLLKLTYNDV